MPSRCNWLETHACSQIGQKKNDPERNSRELIKKTPFWCQIKETQDGKTIQPKLLIFQTRRQPLSQPAGASNHLLSSSSWTGAIFPLGFPLYLSLWKWCRFSSKSVIQITRTRLEAAFECICSMSHCFRGKAYVCLWCFFFLNSQQHEQNSPCPFVTWTSQFHLSSTIITVNWGISLTDGGMLGFHQASRGTVSKNPLFLHGIMYLGDKKALCVPWGLTVGTGDCRLRLCLRLPLICTSELWW